MALRPRRIAVGLVQAGSGRTDQPPGRVVRNSGSTYRVALAGLRHLRVGVGVRVRVGEGRADHPLVRTDVPSRKTGR